MLQMELVVDMTHLSWMKPESLSLNEIVRFLVPKRSFVRGESVFQGAVRAKKASSFVLA